MNTARLQRCFPVPPWHHCVFPKTVFVETFLHVCYKHLTRVTNTATILEQSPDLSFPAELLGWYPVERNGITVPPSLQILEICTRQMNMLKRALTRMRSKIATRPQSQLILFSVLKLNFSLAHVLWDKNCRNVDSVNRVQTTCCRLVLAGWCWADFAFTTGLLDISLGNVSFSRTFLWLSVFLCSHFHR